MAKFVIDPDFWAVFPEAQINVLTVKNIDNHVPGDTSYFSELLNNASKESAVHLTAEVFSQNQVIDEWRKAFAKFKTKKGARSSIEALLKRAYQGREFTPINPLVDIYNSISLKYAVPCGGEDLHKIVGDLHLGKAKGGESFLPLGADEDAPALPGEIMYFDDEGSICRCLNWREAQRTMLTEETTDAVLVIEAINSQQTANANEAINELKQLMDAYFNTESAVKYLTKDEAVFEL
ncbi:hypothetical protein IEO70_04030 [Bacillus sp. AGMB 02131]|uniref:B3/B4 tRNA-binding domain-containing protein n=1 Tax=Peribacillus faecalis TaxID=2772559 RepID=A0A927H9E9_9BACI|nr:phenylalanine--tRNA ligase beta subunit-related protein [Peribacillus faecalis]MBD3107525.1 hypothetical protein [Peribacillus faecalis]